MDGRSGYSEEVYPCSILAVHYSICPAYIEDLSNFILPAIKIKKLKSSKNKRDFILHIPFNSRSLDFFARLALDTVNREEFVEFCPMFIQYIDSFYLTCY